MIVLMADYYTQEGKDDEVAAVLREMAAFCNSDQEPGCAMYIVNRAVDDPRHFLLYEQYVDQAALEAHTQTPLFQEKILGTVVPMLERRERSFWEIVG
jgi:(4S)-4-hydroxy-5-phosphonooxypentane-2,3-dione isomerase